MGHTMLPAAEDLVAAQLPVVKSSSGELTGQGYGGYSQGGCEPHRSAKMVWVLTRTVPRPPKLYTFWTILQHLSMGIRLERGASRLGLCQPNHPVPNSPCRAQCPLPVSPTPHCALHLTHSNLEHNLKRSITQSIGTARQR